MVMHGESYDHRPSHPYNARTEHRGVARGGAHVMRCLSHMNIGRRISRQCRDRAHRVSPSTMQTLPAPGGETSSGVGRVPSSASCILILLGTENNTNSLALDDSV